MSSVHVDRRNHLLAFVHISHFPQKRKYTGEPYTVHLRAVAEMADKHELIFGYEIGLLHDILEDTNVTSFELTEWLVKFYRNSEVDFIVNSVIDLTDVFTHEKYPEFNRNKRKELECQRMAQINPNSQSIKYCDLIDNTKSIVQHDPVFSKIYQKEKFKLLQVMDKGDNILYNMALKNNQ